MQTFLPDEDFETSAKMLDRVRLGKQRVECLQIMKALTDDEYGWQNHPIVNMWRGFEGYLYDYSRAICNEWVKRGYKDTCMDKIKQIFWSYFTLKDRYNQILEKKTMCWLGCQELHDSHKSNLLRKNPQYYKQFNWNVSDNLDYKWFKINKDEGNKNHF